MHPKYQNRRHKADPDDFFFLGPNPKHRFKRSPPGEQVVSESEDVGDAPKGKGGAVPDGLHPGDGPPSFQERCSQGPSAQLGPLPGPGLSSERPPDGAQEIPRREETVAGEAAGRTNEDGSTFRGSTESRTEGATERGETKRLNLGDNVETH